MHVETFILVYFSLKSLICRATNILKEFVSICCIAIITSLTYLDKLQLFEMMNNNKVGYRINAEMMDSLMTEIGFMKEGYCEYDLYCLTPQGQNLGTTRASFYIELSGWKPTIVPFLCSYFNEKLATCAEVKPGEFITLDDIIAAITGQVKEKTGRRYVTQMEVEALKNNDTFRPFYVDRAGPQRWRPACIPLIIDYIVADSTPPHG